MRHKKIIRMAWSISFTAFLLTSCEKKASKIDVVGSESAKTMTLIQSINAAKSVIFTGEWNEAESAWAKLERPTYTATELDEWIAFQREVIEQTTGDKLKSGLRMNAMQQMYFHPEVSIKYTEWLRDGLATNLFQEPGLSTKASELLRDLERDSKDEKK